MALPHVVLHDHLDGGLRVETLLDLADRVGHRLPHTDPDDLTDFFDQAGSGSLEAYLAAFDHTVAVLQNPEALARAAFETIEDLAAAGAVHAEIRYAPMLSTPGGLPLEGVMEAILDGLRRAGRETGTSWGFIADAMRQHDDSPTVAEAAVRFCDQGVVGFDLAGPEAGHPPDRHLPAIRAIREHGLGLTIHAGESAGVVSIANAVNRCGADRLGHGIEIIDDVHVVDGRVEAVGKVAGVVRDRRIPLEVCTTSNLATKGWTAPEHPVGLLHRAGFTVTLNTDNRLMSNTTMGEELELVQRHHGFDVGDLLTVTRRALKAAFVAEPTRRTLWEERIAPAYRAEGVTVPVW